jgi:gliding motility-associated-like protein
MIALIENRRVLLVIAFFFCFFTSSATHNRAGEITFCQSESNYLTYNFTIITYTAVGNNVTADRCELFLYFGNASATCGIFDSIPCPRINGMAGCNSSVFPSNMVHMGEEIQPGIKKNIYTGTYTFNGPGSYCIGVSDPNRNENIVNISNSVNQAFYIQSTLVISPFLGNNCSPILLNPPVDNACYCKRYIHNPGAYDPDGDSLSYSLISCRGDFGQPLSCYFIPSGVSINAVTGDMTWTCPGANTIDCNGNNAGGIGEYNLAILITEWRSGIQVGSVVRDMQIKVVAGCMNNPPSVQPFDTCVIAGNPVNLLIKATDPDPGQLIEMTATGEIFQLQAPADFVQTVNQPNYAESQLTWNTTCKDIRKRPYLVSVKAQDSYQMNPLVDLKTISIRVVAPPPVLQSVQPQGTTINLSWQASACPGVKSYQVFRKTGPSSFIPGPCVTGIPSGYGFVKIADLQQPAALSFADNNNGAGLSHGFEYCYRIVGVYADGSLSIASNELCAKLKRDVPVLTKISVGITSTTSGKDTLRWKKPVEFDSLQWPAPYSYRIERSASGFAAFSVIDTLSGINQLQFVDTALNTSNVQYTYRVGFYSGSSLVGYSNAAQSPFLGIRPADNRLTLRWPCTVPWRIDSSYIYQEEPTGSGNFSFLAVTQSDSFAVNGLANGSSYCFRVLVFGAYADTGFERPLLNFSQIACGIPQDKTPPCPPVFTVTPDCEKIINTLQIIQNRRDCYKETVNLLLYFAPIQGDSLQNIRTFAATDTLQFHTLDTLSIAGCYALAGIDSAGNISAFSDTICVDNCPVYELPNIFTPNRDGMNDVFRPFPFKFVKQINMVVYDRWGAEVFATKDPAVLWNGTHQKTGMPCDAGVYYYVCDVGELRLTGIVNRRVTGFVQIISSNNENNR